MSGGKAAKRTATKRKTAGRNSSSKSKKPIRKTAKKKSPKKKAVKRKTAKRAAPPRAKRKVAKKKAAKKTAKKTVKKTVKKKAVKKKSATKKSSAVKKIVSAAKKAARGKVRATRIEKMIFSELENLASYIHDAKQEIAAIRPDEVKDDFLPKAEIELGAIVEATAEATHTIMDACDGLDGLMSQLEGDAASTLMDATTKIYEACTFQDITGQRINKVVKTLQHIEARVDKLIDVFGIKIEKSVSDSGQGLNTGKSDKISDEDLLEGPQLKGQGKSQSEIDDLLASFD
ncbi:MAG: protein phosphatase CheZ [Rhodospirillaceae bacterium]|nr:protein phosphatase CheZ [Rhodospirillaceae bacterium]